MAEYLSWDGLQDLGENLTLSGCEHSNRGANVKKTGGINILGWQVIEPKTSYKVVCYLKRGAACGYPCPINIPKKKIDGFFDKAEALK